jgi:hypothetical protein
VAGRGGGRLCAAANALSGELARRPEGIGLDPALAPRRNATPLQNFRKPGNSGAGSFASSIKGFSDGEVIDLLGTAATSFTYMSNVLDVYDNSTLVASLNVGAGYSQSSFALAYDGNGGTDILDPKTTSLAARAAA